MSQLWEKSGHVAVKHENCQINHCRICDGGLTVCARCGLGEGSLTTHCPGVDAFEHGDAVYRGNEDFIDGMWRRGHQTPFMYPDKMTQRPGGAI